MVGMSDDVLPATQTAVIVPVPSSEPLVGKHRSRLDAAAAWGVPAHVTVLYPFVSPADIDESVIGRLGRAVASVQAFDCRFDRCDWFGEEVLWLAPDPADGFQALTAAVCAAFPNYPPYGGAFDGVVPHLTVGERKCGTLDDLRAAERDVRTRLPVGAYIDHALLIAGAAAPASWRTVRRLPLAGSPAATATALPA